MTLGSAPSVNAGALREFSALISAVGIFNRTMVKDGYLSHPDTGGACATDEVSVRPQPADAVPPTVPRATVDRLPGRGAGAGAEAAIKVSSAPAQGTDSRAGGAR